MDRVRIELGSQRSLGLDITEYQELGELAREGLAVVRDAPPERQATLLWMAAFADFLVERISVMQQEWKERLTELIASGELPDQSQRGGQS